ncbi:MAG TPA: hypothetical protein VK118_05250 [Tetragenococcus sp.]|nr:hypothetical protein [Tetragenococcus sp.]
MDEVYIDLIVNVIIENFGSENAFYQGQLGISAKNWEDWKKGSYHLKAEDTQKIKNLFSDYEWMLLQKILRQTIIYPEKRRIAVAEYRRIKTKVARQWLNIGLATVELIEPKDDTDKKHYLDLKIGINYDEWGFDDILNFRLPAYIQQQIKSEEVALLDWVNQNLEETYGK